MTNESNFTCIFTKNTTHTTVVNGLKERSRLCAADGYVYLVYMCADRIDLVQFSHLISGKAHGHKQ